MVFSPETWDFLKTFNFSPASPFKNCIGDYEINKGIKTLNECKVLCADDKNCRAVVMNNKHGHCYLKGYHDPTITHMKCIDSTSDTSFLKNGSTGL
jgi:hypothetical protein